MLLHIHLQGGEAVHREQHKSANPTLPPRSRQSVQVVWGNSGRGVFLDMARNAEANDLAFEA